MTKSILILITVVLIYGCASNRVSGYKEFYTQFEAANTLSADNLVWLEQGTEPEVIKTENVKEDFKALQESGYFPLGVSSFKGAYEDTELAVEQAKKIGATHILIHNRHTGTVVSSSSRVIPKQQTSFYSGYPGENDPYSVPASGSYYGSGKTNYGSIGVPISGNLELYEQSAVFFVRKK